MARKPNRKTLCFCVKLLQPAVAAGVFLKADRFLHPVLQGAEANPVGTAALRGSLHGTAFGEEVCVEELLSDIKSFLAYRKSGMS